MGKFRKILDVLLDREEKQQTDTVQDAEVIEEVNYKQASGTMVSVDANDVAVAVEGLLNPSTKADAKDIIHSFIFIAFLFQ
jgi:hypothetical protein